MCCPGKDTPPDVPVLVSVPRALYCPNKRSAPFAEFQAGWQSFLPAERLTAECTARVRSFRHRPLPGVDRADSHPQYRASSCRCQSYNHNLARGLDEQSQLRFGHRPAGIGTNAYRLVWAHHTWACCLEEKLRTLGRVNTIVKVAAPRAPGFFHARITAAIVGDTGGPYLLAYYRSKNPCRIKVKLRTALCRAAHVCVQIIPDEELVPASSRYRIEMATFFHKDALCCPVELQVSPPYARVRICSCIADCVQSHARFGPPFGLEKAIPSSSLHAG